jgi:hypothetical protein
LFRLVFLKPFWSLNSWRVFAIQKLCNFEPLRIFKTLISKATIDTVFETARVEEVIGDFVQLKRAGSNYKGLSPFSDERSPSFMVSPCKTNLERF